MIPYDLPFSSHYFVPDTKFDFAIFLTMKFPVNPNKTSCLVIG